MGFLTLSLDTSSLSLFVDGQNRGKFNLPIALEEGEHQVEIRKDAKIVSSKTVVVRGKEHKSVAVGIFEIPSEQKGKASEDKYPETTISPGAPLPAYASNTMLAFMLAVVLIPILYLQQNFNSLIIMGGVGLLSMYGITRQKKWGLALVGGIYLLLLFNWGYVSVISIAVLILLFVYYRKDGTTWEWF